MSPLRRHMIAASARWRASVGVRSVCLKADPLSLSLVASDAMLDAGHRERSSRRRKAVSSIRPPQRVVAPPHPDQGDCAKLPCYRIFCAERCYSARTSAMGYGEERGAQAHARPGAARATARGAGRALRRLRPPKQVNRSKQGALRALQRRGLRARVLARSHVLKT